MKKVFIVLPAYNESTVIADVIKELKTYNKNIIVVNDCSTDNTAQIAKKAGATIFSHPINRGAGAATKTGLDAAYALGATHVVTLDSDGQHSPKDLMRVLSYADKYDVVIGSRMINNKGMPFIRKAYNTVGSIITYLLYGIYVKDSQTGFKVFNRKSIEKIDITFDRYEFCSEVLHEIKKHKLTFKEVPIQVIYTEYSQSKGQHFLSGVRMVYKMIMKLFMGGN